MSLSSFTIGVSQATTKGQVGNIQAYEVNIIELYRTIILEKLFGVFREVARREICQKHPETMVLHRKYLDLARCSKSRVGLPSGNFTICELKAMAQK